MQVGSKENKRSTHKHTPLVGFPYFDTYPYLVVAQTGDLGASSSRRSKRWSARHSARLSRRRQSGLSVRLGRVKGDVGNDFL